MIVNKYIDLSDKKIERIVRRYINEYADELRKHFNLKKEQSKNLNIKFNMDEVTNRIKLKLQNELQISEETLANYVIKVSYNSLSISKSFAWSGYSEYIIKNLKENSNSKKQTLITEVPNNTSYSYEYLGKYYLFKEMNIHR